ncbi:uncharacterized protein LOC129908136 [Episyrphus balteatus]|uniref:uncharacterized protein LOC129908136 n=1 Tax=Episyrphus balteatus TaxID=286459 RepID=UPI002486591C|nr:uncharacterized protein LOC129908136 [Episyrphus balteatus]
MPVVWLKKVSVSLRIYTKENQTQFNMFKFFALCLMACVALAAAKPGIVAPLAYTAAYSSPLIASPYTAAAYTAAAYSAPLVASPYYASPYAAAYSAYPYASAPLLLRR